MSQSSQLIPGAVVESGLDVGCCCSSGCSTLQFSVEPPPAPPRRSRRELGEAAGIQSFKMINNKTTVEQGPFVQFMLVSAGSLVLA